jgi:small subunit ribosomal protein S21
LHPPNPERDSGPADFSTKGGDSDMIIVPLKEGENIERALKRFKRKFEKTGAIRELRARKNFVKPSVKRREQIQKAIYVQHLQLEEEQ